MSLTLVFKEKTPFRNIGEQPYCIWHYQLSLRAPKPPVSGTHIVQEGDTLWAIAGKFLGDPRRWREIYLLNKDQILHPNIIFPGQVFLLPTGLGLESEVAVGFLTQLDIKDPLQFQGVDKDKLVGMGLQKSTNAAVQYVTARLNQSHNNILDFFFVAPCAQNSSTPVILATKAVDATGWTDLAFSTEPVGQSPEGQQTLPGPAVVDSPFPGGGSGGDTGQSGVPSSGHPPVLISETRRVPKCTYVPLNVPEVTIDSGRALVKFGFVRRLALQPGEVEAVRRQIPTLDNSQLRTLQAFEGSPMPSQLPSPNVLASMPVPVLQALGKAVVGLRQQAVDHVQRSTQSPAARSDLATPRGTRTTISLLNSAIMALNGFEANVTPTPIGMLNLERIEMTPVGIERGALVATIPLAPLEKTAVVHKEWSVTTKEFTSIVTDSLENYSETGVTENTELATATTSQTSHSNQFNVNGTVSGTYGPVSAMVASSFTSQDQNSDSANESRKHAIATTRKASSRVRQEHKVTISTTTVTGTSETSTRVLENPSTTNPIRIDYFSMMRKWHVGLYRYGLRLTYDIAIPEPGAAMRKTYADIANLRSQLGPFYFPWKHGDISEQIVDNDGNPPASGAPGIPKYQWLGDKYGVQGLPALPDAQRTITVSQVPEHGLAAHLSTMNIPTPDGYFIDMVSLDGGAVGDTGHGIGYGIVGTTFFNTPPKGDQPEFRQPTDQIHPLIDVTTGERFLSGAEGPRTVGVYMVDVTQGALIVLTIQLKRTPKAYTQWQSDVWNALYNAAQTQYYAQQQEIAARIAQLEDQLNNVDTLTLRREENEEIMKGVLRWLLGPTFDFMPEEAIKIFTGQKADPEHGASLDRQHGVAFTGSQFGDAAIWPTMFAYEEMVKFINEAIEWENVLYFLYSYFWDVPPSWDFIRQIRHPDAMRQAFLRSGSARVVLTVRKGWETAWVSFVETGGFGTTFPKLLPDHPYLTIASEIENYDRTNYPGIPPANPGGGPLPDSGACVATQSSDSLTPSAGPMTIKVKSSDGFIVGYTAIIDSYDSGEQETQTITAVPDATHITVERLGNRHDGSKKPFPVMQAGEKGQLIAEWFEYTPTSGTDIAVTSNLASIA